MSNPDDAVIPLAASTAAVEAAAVPAGTVPDADAAVGYVPEFAMLHHCYVNISPRRKHFLPQTCIESIDGRITSRSQHTQLGTQGLGKTRYRAWCTRSCSRSSFEFDSQWFVCSALCWLAIRHAQSGAAKWPWQCRRGWIGASPLL